MRTAEQIRLALDRLNKYHDSREDVIDAVHEDRLTCLQASLQDHTLAESAAITETLEWVLGINSDPKTENRLDHLLQMLGT